MSILNPRANPSLPQNDSAAERQKRLDQLAAAAAEYAWNDQVDTLPGVPLAGTVPKDQRPTLSWLLMVAEVGIEIAANQLLSKISDGDHALARSGASALQTHLNDMRDTVAAIRRDHAATPEGVLRSLTHVAPMLSMLHRIRINGQLNVLQEMVTTSYRGGAASALKQFRDLFVTLPLPAIADSFLENQTFARMRVAGPNSVLLQGISALPANFPLSGAQYQQVMGADDTLAGALAERRVYLVDYAELASLVPGETNGASKFVCFPIALFAVPKGGRALMPVAIQLGQDPATSAMVLRVDDNSSPDWWAWQMARVFVQVADGNYHELFVHLARTHLVIEAFAVATHRQLAAEHPLNLLLLPHFEGTLFINNAAAGSLIKAGGPIDHIFAGTMQSSQQTAVDGRLRFDFAAHRLPTNIKARGVDDANALPDYPYRDDALLVWAAIENWVADYVAVYYGSDQDVTADYELAAWVAEVQGNGKIRGFGAIATRQQLVDALTMILFTASAQHAAVNFPQRDLMSFAPAITGAAWAATSTVAAGASEAQWLALMPPIAQAQEQLSTLWLLGSIHYRPLGDYRLNHWPYPDWFQDPRVTAAGGPLQRFQAALKVIDAQIDARNLERAVPYDYLKPSLIPTSINI